MSVFLFPLPLSLALRLSLSLSAHLLIVCNQHTCLPSTHHLLTLRSLPAWLVAPRRHTLFDQLLCLRSLELYISSSRLQEHHQATCLASLPSPPCQLSTRDTPCQAFPLGFCFPVPCAKPQPATFLASLKALVSSDRPVALPAFGFSLVCDELKKYCVMSCLLKQFGRMKF